MISSNSLRRFLGTAFGIGIAVFLGYQPHSTSAQTQATAATCSAAPPTAAVTMESTAMATAFPTAALTETPTEMPTALATSPAAEAAPIRLISFQPTDIHFNPNPDKPVALIMVFSLIFQNQLDQALHVEAPRFQLAIDGVPWGALSSTDFQTGQLLAGAQQGIVLQSLTIIPQTNAAQQPILACLRTQQPVDLTLTGTMNVFPGGVTQSVTFTFLTPTVIVHPHQAVAAQ